MVTITKIAWRLKNADHDHIVGPTITPLVIESLHTVFQNGPSSIIPKMRQFWVWKWCVFCCSPFLAIVTVFVLYKLIFAISRLPDEIYSYSLWYFLYFLMTNTLVTSLVIWLVSKYDFVLPVKLIVQIKKNYTKMISAKNYVVLDQKYTKSISLVLSPFWNTV